MPDEEAVSATVETPETEAAEETAATEETTGQEEEKSPDSERETPAEDDSGESDETKSDSEERASETAKRQAIELRTLKRELREMKRQIEQPRQPVPELKPPVEPSLEDFYTSDDPNTAYTEALKKFRSDTEQYAVTKDRRERAEQAKKDSTEKQKKADMEVWTKRERETAKRHADYNLQDAYDDVSPNPVMDGFLMESDIGPDLLWHLRGDPELSEQIRAMKPYQAVRKLIELEANLSNEIKGIKPRAPTTKPMSAVKGEAARPASTKSTADLLYGT